ncbi:4Fe-4S dicluster domain-containing protein [Candidatus Sumerlaeota bacterium]
MSASSDKSPRAAAAARAILTDTTLCTGCETCVRACKKDNGLGPDQPRRWQRAIDDLSATRFTSIVRRKGGRYVRKQCRHCLEPACVSACIVGALAKTPEGPVIYDAGKCMGCRYCMVACPYGIPRYEWEKAAPVIRKCDMCYDRVLDGGEPACTANCPEKATIFGTREELLAEARKRLKAEPKKYKQKIFGEFQVGGTSVLYIADISLDFLGWKPELGEESLPDKTWAALGKVPPLVLGMGGLMAGVWWIIGRRMQMQAQAAARARAAEAPPASADERKNTSGEQDE